jgi:hypothetical protein
VEAGVERWGFLFLYKTNQPIDCRWGKGFFDLWVFWIGEWLGRVRRGGMGAKISFDVMDGCHNYMIYYSESDK